MEELKVKNVIIGKQFESCENYEKLIHIVEEKNIKVIVVEAGQKFMVEKNLHFTILWPNLKHKVTDNVLNNNSLVCKLEYKNFSMLFTGDIEEIAEKEILNTYKDNLKILKSTILKVAHHGSKSSSTEELLKAVNPQIAFIGVGENNNFGHPNAGVIERLERIPM